MTDREPASMSEASNPCVIWECIYDHGNGKFMGAASQAQRERAFAELRRLHAEVEALRADAERLNHIEKHARCDPKMDGNHVWWPTSFKHVLKGPTLRAAIDAARKAII